MKLTWPTPVHLAVWSLLSLTSAFSLPSQDTGAEPIPYPTGYRFWTHVKSAVNDDSFGKYTGVYNIYANALALEGYRAGVFPDGAVLVFDMHGAEIDGHVTQPTDRHFIDVMTKDSSKFEGQGGWGYEEFDRDSRSVRNLNAAGVAPECAACHAQRERNDFVFSTFQE